MSAHSMSIFYQIVHWFKNLFKTPEPIQYHVIIDGKRLKIRHENGKLYLQK